MKIALLLITAFLLAFIQTDDRTRYFPIAVEYPEALPEKHNLWIFMMAGQSNMAGRGQVEPQDTLSHPRVFTLDRNGNIVLAKSPLHYLEPTRTGLDLGHRFGYTLITQLPDSISVLLVPTAVGGSAISQWLDDELFRGVHLRTNFREQLDAAMQRGTPKAVLWHQGESDANDRNIPYYQDRITELFRLFREYAGNEQLPVILGELGLHDKNAVNRARINDVIHDYAANDPRSAVVPTTDLSHIGDSTHFSSEALRTMGERYAQTYLNTFHATETVQKRGFWQWLRGLFR
ncbi:MAG: sialate O-acetylesterase [Bacteroidetes bacterium]|nr:sialate O-acetylesterase [Bacteroidota bacterium]